MSSTPEAAATPKKTPAKTSVSETTTKRIPVQRIRGWSAFETSAYGIVPNTRKLDLCPIAPATLKKRTDADGTLILVAKPVTVLLAGTASLEEDGRVLVRVDDNTNAIQRQVEDLFMASTLALLPEAEGKQSYANYYGDNLVKLKEKHFQGRYVSKFRNGTRDDTLKAADAFSGKPVQIVAKYYGAFSSDEIYGPLVTVAAFNLVE